MIKLMPILQLIEILMELSEELEPNYHLFITLIN